jgi:hypothetical protein
MELLDFAGPGVYFRRCVGRHRLVAANRRKASGPDDVSRVKAYMECGDWKEDE